MIGPTMYDAGYLMQRMKQREKVDDTFYGYCRVCGKPNENVSGDIQCMNCEHRQSED